MLYDNYLLKYLFIAVLVLLILGIADLAYKSIKRIITKEDILYSYTVGGSSRSGVIVQAICNKKTDQCLCFNESTMEPFPCPE